MIVLNDYFQEKKKVTYSGLHREHKVDELLHKTHALSQGVQVEPT